MKRIIFSEIETIVKSYVDGQTANKPLMLIFDDQNRMDDLRHKIDRDMYPGHVHSIDKENSELYRRNGALSEQPLVNVYYSYVDAWQFDESHIQYCLDESKGIPLICFGDKRNYPSVHSYNELFDIYEVL